MSIKWTKIYLTIYKKAKMISLKSFFAFLFFLFLSISVWFFYVLGLNHTTEYNIPIRYVQDSTCCIASKVPTIIKVRVKDNGFQLMEYDRQIDGQSIEIDLQHRKNMQNAIVISNAELYNLLKQYFSPFTQLQLVEPQVIYIFCDESDDNENYP